MVANLEPRPYQHRIVAKALDMFAGRHVNRFGNLEPPAASILIESPTGSGKTVMGLSIAKALHKQHGVRIGWVSMRRNLLAQAAAENQRRGFDLPLELISMFCKEPPKVDLLIVDEAQHDAATSMANLHSIVQPKMTIGLSATPFRSDRVKLCFEKRITDAGIGQLIEDGYLSRYRHFTIPAYTPELVAEFYSREASRWGKSLIFFHRHEECRRCQHYLATREIVAEVVTGESDRERQLADFALGRVEVLLSMMVLTEGFDCPSLRTVFCRPSGRGCTVQMGGRVFRQHPEIPFKQIVQCSKTRHPFLKTAAAAEQYVWLEGGWKSLRLNEHLAAISSNALRVIAAAPAQLPKLVLDRRPRSNRWRFRQPLPA